MPIHTVFLDAGGILVYPNWSRVSETMERHGVLVTAQALSDAEPRAKQRLDRGETIQGTNDEQRGWTYFDLVLTEAGVPLTPSTAAALMELNAYHRQFNLWETVPDDVPPALAALRARGLRSEPDGKGGHRKGGQILELIMPVIRAIERRRVRRARRGLPVDFIVRHPPLDLLDLEDRQRHDHDQKDRRRTKAASVSEPWAASCRRKKSGS